MLMRSKARSEAIKFGIRQSMRSGNVNLNHKQFLWYAKDRGKLSPGHKNVAGFCLT